MLEYLNTMWAQCVYWRKMAIRKKVYLNKQCLRMGNFGMNIAITNSEMIDYQNFGNKAGVLAL